MRFSFSLILFILFFTLTNSYYLQPFFYNVLPSSQQTGLNYNLHCSNVDTTQIPLTPYDNGYYYFDGNYKLLRGRNMPAIMFKMSSTDSMKIDWRMKINLPHKAAYIMGTGESNWVIGSGTHSENCIEIFNLAAGGWKTIYNLDPTDTSWRTYKIVWHKTDSVLYCYMNDTLQNIYRSYKWQNSVSSQPFTLGHGNVPSTSTGAGTIPVNQNLYYKGYIDWLRIHKYQMTSDSSFIYNLNEGGQNIYDSVTYRRFEATSPDGSSLGNHLQNGFGPSKDSSDAMFIKEGSYTSVFSPVGYDGIFYSQNATGYWINSQIWNGCRLRDSLLAIVGTFNRINAIASNPNSGDTSNGVAQYNIKNNTWSSLQKGVDNNYAEKVIQYRGDAIITGPFTSVGNGVPNTKHIARWNGNSWSALGTGLNNNARSLFVWGDSLYAGGIFSTAGGVNANCIAKWNGSEWAALGLGCNYEVEDMAEYKGSLYAGGRFLKAGGITVGNIARWDGVSWHAVGTGVNPTGVVYVMHVFNGELYCAGDFTSMNGIPCSVAAWNGTNWRAVTTTSGFINRTLAMAVFQNYLYVSSDFYWAGNKTVNKIFRTDGFEICPLNYGFDLPIWQMVPIENSLYILGQFYYADGNNYNNILKYTSIAKNGHDNQGSIPTEFFLKQNYPNPFNPMTSIEYGLPSPGMVQLVVYDILGRVVKTLINEFKNAGLYSVDFDGNSFASGVYFYRLRVNDFVQTYKMVLVK